MAKWARRIFGGMAVSPFPAALPIARTPSSAQWGFKDFEPHEVACPCCGELHDSDYGDEFIVAMRKLQALRTLIDRPLIINSGYRCPDHNRDVGGAPYSYHMKFAVDISLHGFSEESRHELARLAKLVGFTGFGYANTFLHLDLGRPRYWFYGDSAKRWNLEIV